ncbi:MAG TPA: hypothetical protein VJZ71_16055 [Phycisphaerae bacterium]|nr:hypothetical protein [Phycisphaerae bacterium]
MSGRNATLALTLGMLGMVGCLGGFPPPPPGIKTSPRAILTGVIVRPHQEIKSNYFHRYKVKFNLDKVPSEFDALIGPYPYNVSPLPDFVAQYRNPIPRIYIASGYVYEAGECPSAETDLVDATAHGSNATMITQVDGAIHRVFLVRKITGTEQATVTLKGVSPTVQIIMNASTTMADQYVEAMLPGPTLTGPHNVAGSGQAGFVADVKAFAGEAALIDASTPP